jgi:hypothetical protein
MNDQEISVPLEIGSVERTLFDELASLVSEERQEEYCRVIAHTRTLSPNDEMLRILEAMGVLALLTRETPAAIATERKLLRNILDASATQASAVEKRGAVHLAARIAAFSITEGIRNRLGPTQNCKVVGRKSAAVIPTVRPTRYMLSSFTILH